ncbi:hypothetical protein [Oleiharenicola lentus]|uniref:hypothetical protein n=1 Tax=Oleiharenicola lentus TaxID=2508720 RepID=UPI003F66812A
MKSISAIRTFLAITLVLTGITLQAAETKSAQPDKKAELAPKTVGPVIELPTFKVQESRIRELDSTIRKLDKLIAREKKKVKSSELDKALNNDKLTTAAAFLGGNSASHLSDVAATRVSLMENERVVLESLKRPRDAAEVTALEKELDQLRITRRNLDNIGRASR